MEKLKELFAQLKAKLTSPAVKHQAGRFLRVFGAFFVPALFGLYRNHALSLPAIGAAIAAGFEVAWRSFFPVKTAPSTEPSDAGDGA